MSATLSESRVLKTGAAMPSSPTQAKPRAAAAAPDPILVRLNEAIRISGFSRSDLYRRASRGEIVFRKCGKSVLVDYASLKAAIDGLPTAIIRVAA
jgi:hypothetical protein